MFVAKHVLKLDISVSSRAIILEKLQENWKPSVDCLRWVESNLVGPEKEEGILKMLGVIAKEDPELAFEELKALPVGQLANSSFTRIISGWAETDFSSARDFILTQLSKEERGNALPSIFDRWLADDLNGAKDFLVQNLSLIHI